jgi:hypothetical protein
MSRALSLINLADISLLPTAELMTERLATFSEKYEFEDEFVESVWMQDMMHFCLVIIYI